MKQALIFLHGNLSDVTHVKEYLSDSFIICADGGVEHALTLGVIPHVAVGDFDSISKEHKDLLQKNNVQMMTYPRDKDFTDGELAIQYALDRKCEGIIVTGILGDRIDHLSANLMYLAMLSRHHRIHIIEHDQKINFVHDRVEICGKVGDEVSLIPFKDDCIGVTTTHLQYPLHKSILPMGSTRGISNVMGKDHAIVTLKSGVLMVVQRKL